MNNPTNNSTNFQRKINLIGKTQEMIKLTAAPQPVPVPQPVANAFHRSHLPTLWVPEHVCVNFKAQINQVHSVT